MVHKCCAIKCDVPLASLVFKS